ncbi:uncharacterized protein LOC126292051 isoform X1 [Schistocerca gregaria]|uniref:uncharacterized protein LOC126292051 isoform X1 n=2 Tax=Schistocerca gregaria TaxID=7010 RepID=UPI00211E90FB|nr:uncharacterized protein LOC126292051 isoform X1 [Schistocerca gregaria]
MVVMLNTCCARYELTKGCIIIGAFWLVISLVVVVGAPLMMRNLEKDMDDVYQHFSDAWNSEKQKMYDITLSVLRATFYGITAMAVVDGICSIMLIFGARQDKPGLVLPWVVEQMVVLPVWALLALAFAVLSYMEGQLQRSTVSVFVLLVRAGVTVYFILVVYSQYRYLRGELVPTSPNRAV